MIIIGHMGAAIKYEIKIKSPLDFYELMRLKAE